MASFEDYDEFGNYIGADLESDEEEDVSQAQFAPQPHVAPLEGYEDEQMHGVDETALMEIDGARQVCHPRLPELIIRLGRAGPQCCDTSRRQAILPICRGCLWP